MKLREIRKIPYRTGECATETFGYTADAFVENIESENYLFIDIFKNKQDSLKIPVVRMIFTKEDWRLYDPGTDKWSRAGITGDMEKVLGYNARFAKEYLRTYLKSEDLVWEFFGSLKEKARYGTWVQALYLHIEEQRDKRREKERTKRKTALEIRQQNTPELPPDLDKWAEGYLFKNKHFLYYKRHNGYAEIGCSKCGKVSTVRTRRGQSFEAQFGPVSEIPRNGQYGVCPSCKCMGEYKTQGRAKDVYGRSINFYVAQPYRENGAVIRYIQADKTYSIQTIDMGNREVMVEAGERTIITEITRTYLEPGKRAKTDYHKYSVYAGREFWDDCNLQGYSIITTKEAVVYPPSYDCINQTFLRYSGAREYSRYKEEYDLKNYMLRYMLWPQIEMFSKMGLYGIVEKLVNCHAGEVIQNQNAKKPEDFLGIRKERLKDLIALQGNTDYLKVWKLEKRYNQNWNWQQCILVHECNIDYVNMKNLLRYTTMEKFLHKMENYSGVQVPKTLLEETQLCSEARARLRNIAGVYLDYLSMRIQRGYDLKNQIYLYPRDLDMAHNQMVLEVNKEENDKRKQEVTAKYPEIQKFYRKLRKKYFYEDDTYIIRPAKSAAEIVEEGRLLHHCVGGDNYLQKHNSGMSTILFLRLKENPNIPYITVEIQDYKILQWYGMKDKKPDQINIQKWLNNYANELKRQELSVGIA